MRKFNYLQRKLNYRTEKMTNCRKGAIFSIAPFLFLHVQNNPF